VYDTECSYFRIDELRIKDSSNIIARPQDIPIQIKSGEKVEEKKVEEKKVTLNNE